MRQKQSRDRKNDYDNFVSISTVGDRLHYRNEQYN